MKITITDIGGGLLKITHSDFKSEWTISKNKNSLIDWTIDEITEYFRKFDEHENVKS